MSPCGWIRTTLDSDTLDSVQPKTGIRYQLRALAPQASCLCRQEHQQFPFSREPFQYAAPLFCCSAFGIDGGQPLHWGGVRMLRPGGARFPAMGLSPSTALGSHIFPLTPTLVQNKSPLLASSWIGFHWSEVTLQCSKDHPDPPTDKTCTPGL